MKYSVAALLLLCLAPASWGGSGQILVCTDAAGRTVVTDRHLAECDGRAVRELDRNGLTRREIAAPPSAAQKRQMQVAEEQRKAQHAARDAQRQSDRALQLSYPSEQHIELARQRAVEGVRELIRQDVAVLALAERRQQEAQAAAEQHLQQNQTVSPALQARLQWSAGRMAELQASIRSREAEIERLHARFDQTLRRYRELAAAAPGRR